MPDLLATVLAFVAGGALAAFFFARREQSVKEQLVAARAEADARRRSEEEAKSTFDALAAKALKANTDEFLKLAQTKLEGTEKHHAGELEQRKQAIEALLKPLAENLAKLKSSTETLEQKREKAYGEMKAHFEHLSKATERLHAQSAALSTALKGSSQARGRWGEMALRNIAEMAGMTEHVEYEMQGTDSEGRRPDMVVKLPGGGAIPVDAKVPLGDYSRAAEEPDPDLRAGHLRAHAAAVKTFMRDLARKDYASAVQGRIDFTVMFVPGEPILAAAFEQNPDLQQEAFQQRVLIATPVTLMALLRTVGIYWRQQQFEENAEQAWEAAREFYERTAVFEEHLAKIGKGLTSALDGYNKAVGSWERSVLPGGRKLEELGVAKETRRTLEGPPPVDKDVRELSSGG